MSKPLSPVKVRVGAKVAWEAYATREEAVEAAEQIKEQAATDAKRGYDFGLCTPGEITGPDEEGLFWVTTS
jgi:hypothetical protein